MWKEVDDTPFLYEIYRLPETSYLKAMLLRGSESVTLGIATLS